MIARKSEKDGKVYRRLSLEESIRMNRMIQGGVDINGFKNWYKGLSRDEQAFLARYLLNIFICEQHYSTCRDVVKKALAATGRTLGDPLVQRLMKSVGGFDLEKGFLAEIVRIHENLEEWMNSLEENDRLSVFELCAFLFGFHEGERFDACAGKCSHWWHQDLKNPDVVKKMLEQNSPSAPAPERKVPFFTRLFGGLNGK